MGFRRGTDVKSKQQSKQTNLTKDYVFSESIKGQELRTELGILLNSVFSDFAFDENNSQPDKAKLKKLDANIGLLETLNEKLRIHNDKHWIPNDKIDSMLNALKVSCENELPIASSLLLATVLIKTVAIPDAELLKFAYDFGKLEGVREAASQSKKGDSHKRQVALYLFNALCREAGHVLTEGQLLKHMIAKNYTKQSPLTISTPLSAAIWRETTSKGKRLFIRTLHDGEVWSLAYPTYTREYKKLVTLSD